MTCIARGLILAAFALLPPAHAADPAHALLNLPVDSSKPIDPVRYQAATQLAAKGATPLEIALAIAGPFEGRAQYIVQVNEAAESPRSVKLTIVRDGLLDDSVRSSRLDISLQRSSGANWGIAAVKHAWRCGRGGAADRFSADPCP